MASGHLEMDLGTTDGTGTPSNGLRTPGHGPGAPTIGPETPSDGLRTHRNDIRTPSHGPGVPLTVLGHPAVAPGHLAMAQGTQQWSRDAQWSRDTQWFRDTWPCSWNTSRHPAMAQGTRPWSRDTQPWPQVPSSGSGHPAMVPGHPVMNLGHPAPGEQGLSPPAPSPPGSRALSGRALGAPQTLLGSRRGLRWAQMGRSEEGAKPSRSVQ